MKPNGNSGRLPSRDGGGMRLGKVAFPADRQPAEGLLRESELRYRRLFETAQDGILILDAETGMVVDVNPFLIGMLGYSHEVFLGKKIWELGFFRDIIGNEANFAELQAKQYIRYEDKPLESSDGRKIEVEFVSNVYLVNERKVIQCNIRDITERKRAAAALERSEGKYRNLFENSRDAIVTSAPPAWKFTSGNPAALKMFGAKSEAEFISQSPVNLSPERQPDGRASDEKAREMIETALREGAHTFEWTHRRIGGGEFPAEVLLTRMEQDGKMMLQATVRDITERKRRDESHARLAMAVEQSAETIVITDTDGRMVYVNPAFEKITGYTRAEAIGQNPRVLKGGQRDAAFYHQMWDTIKSGKVWEGHFINKRKDGTLYEEEATISPVRDAAGTVINFVAAKRDVTREMRLEAQLRQKQKMDAIGTLAGGMAHDFNNILAIIQMQASLLKNAGPLSPKQTELADEICATVNRAADLTRQLLLFSRKENLQPHDLDLNQAVTDLTKMLRRVLSENIGLELKLAEQPMFVRADQNMMDQVLMNLAANARDAMPEGGQLLIETSAVEFDEFAATQSALARPGSFVRLSVSDSGCGIPPELLPRIFDPFFTTKDAGKGTGLGLATVMGIVQQHQGWINAYSEVGRGTTFRIYLPRLAGLTGQQLAQQMLAVVPTGNETILLAEDDPVLRGAIRKTLAHLGYRVLEAPTGVKALDVWREHRADIRLLLTDMVMPDGLTGKGLAECLLRENSKLKVVYMSGYPEIAGKTFSLNEGVIFLAKPFETPKLAQMIRHRLDE